MAIPSYSDFDLKEYPLSDISELTIGIVRTEWNPDIIKRLVDSCQSTLLNLGLSSDNISTYTVPGSYELPLGAKYILNSKQKPDAVICLGCVIQGETKHDDYINHTIARNISHLSMLSNTPVIFGVLTTNTLEQAMERSGGNHGNKGEESALAALKMISLRQQLLDKGSRISF